jgi:apolipoprotein N-acyltransferase
MCPASSLHDRIHPLTVAPAANADGLIRRAGWLRDVLLVAGLATITALPWIDQRFVPLTWIALAVPLAFVGQLRGWRGETMVLATTALALSIAFHWAPTVLTRCLDTTPVVGFLVTVPIILWDAIRLALPFWFIGRVVRDPQWAWLAAGLAASFAEWIVPGVFPWKIGFSQINWPVIVQSADLLGPEFTTLIAFAHAGVLVGAVRLLVAAVRRKPSAQRGTGWKAAVLVPLLLCVANVAYGVWAIRHWTAAMADAARLHAAVVQVDPTPDDATPALQAWTRRACAEFAPGRGGRDGLASQGGAEEPFDVVIWPECSGGSYHDTLESLADERQVWRLSRDPLRGLRPLESPSCPLLFGGKIYSGEPEKPRSLFQSAILIDREERIIGRYHKRHLMPFGEYVPGGHWLHDIKLLFPMEDEFHLGQDAVVLQIPGKANLGVMLCYEDMVPATARSLVREGADILVSLINGSSFTDPLTLRQHRLLAQLRAVECRRSFIRCAATGETCLINPVGVIEKRLPLHVQDVLVVEAPLLKSQTVYAMVGPVFPPTAALLLGLAAGWSWHSRRAAGGTRQFTS